MFRDDQPKPTHPAQGQLLEIPKAHDIPAGDKARIAKLIANGKFDIAVDLAKQVHKRFYNSASEALLVDAYAARIKSLEERNLAKEAKALLESVLQRFRSSAERLRDLAASTFARDGDADGLLKLLVDPAFPEESRAAISKRIGQDIVDLLAVSRSSALPPGHPIRIAAGALAKAFEAVTSGPVAAEALVLAEVSRQSPLAPWKMLLRAIAAFYSRDDERCEKSLAAIESDAAAACLAPVIRMLMGQKQTITPAGLELVKQTGGSLETLHARLRELDLAFEKKNHLRTFEEIRNTISVCKQTCPELLERLKQHISVRCWIDGMNAEQVVTALSGPSLKNAYFWRLLARGAEQHDTGPKAIPFACRCWEEFRKHAVHEGWFQPNGPEAATLFLHMADLAQRLPGDYVEEIGMASSGGAINLKAFYDGQPPAIRALMPSPGIEQLDFLRAHFLYERAATADPHTETFRRWLNWVKRNQPHAAGQVAGMWRTAFPGDLQPLLHLMEGAEKSNALQKAFKLMEEAERLDGLNPAVRKARLRLLISITIRHLQQKKPHLVDKDLAALAALPQVQQGDRPAFAHALRWAAHAGRGSSEQAANSRAEVARLLDGEIAASIVLAGVARAAKLNTFAPEPPKTGDGASIAGPVGRACALGEDMGFNFEIPSTLSTRILKELSKGGPGSELPGLLPLGEAALRAFNHQLAFAVSAAGLAGNGASQARFLFLRARALPESEYQRQTACFGAAAELARRQRDLDLLDRIGDLGELGGFNPMENAALAMSTEQIESIVQQERQMRAYPKSSPRWGRSRPARCNCAVCRAQAGSQMDEMEDFGLGNFNPDDIAQALAEIMGMGRKQKPGRKRRGIPDPSDYSPF